MNGKDQQHSILKGYNMLLYFAGSMIMYEPSEECVTDFWTKGILKNLPVTSLNPNFIRAESQLRDSCSDNKTCGKRLREDFKRLFSAGDSSLAPAFETFYRNIKSPAAESQDPEVSEFYKSYGWVSKFKGKISDDHLGVELFFLTLLIEKYIVLEDDACRGEMKKEIRRFLNTHILPWITDWNKKVQANGNTLCFKGIGTLIVACTEDIYSVLDQNFSSAAEAGFLRN